MPPNRQSLVDISDALSSIHVSSLVKEETAAAFAPLTEQDFAAPNQEDDVVVSNPNASDSYWDWPAEPKSEKQTIIDSIVQQEEIRQVLSVEHIEETLTSSSSFKDDTDEDDSCRLVQAHDDYWNMPSETDNAQEPNNVIVVAQHVQDVTHPKNSYWDWDTTTRKDKARVIATILRDEEARHLTSVQHVQENLLRAAAVVVQPESSAESTTRTRHVDASHDEYWQWSSSDVVVTASHVGDPTHPRSSYWDWQSSQQTTDSNSKQATIDKILRDEQARQVMLHEPQASCQPSSPQHMVSAAGDDDNNSSSYWEW